jgi:hypothetical protein
MKTPDKKKRKYNKIPVDLKAISEETGISYATLHFRYKNGYDLRAPTVKIYHAFKRGMTMDSWAAELGRDAKGLYDRVRYYSTEYEMDEKQALEYVLSNGGITE